MNKPLFLKLLKLKQRLTLSDVAEYLSKIWSANVTEADVLQFALNRDLKLSIYFVKETWAAPCHVVHYKETELKAACANNIYPEELNWRKDSVGMELVSLKIGDDKFLNMQKKEWSSISGLWDLPMIDGDRLEIEQAWRNLTGSPIVTRPSCYGTFLQDDNGIIYRLRDGSNISDALNENKAKQNALRREVAINNISKENEEKLFQLLEEEREVRIKECHSDRAKLPEDHVLIVRLEALETFEQFISDNELKTDTATTHTNNKPPIIQRVNDFNKCMAQVIYDFNEDNGYQATTVEEVINRLKHKPPHDFIISCSDNKISVDGSTPKPIANVERTIKGLRNQQK
ncbi:MAG: hypothetical protein EXR80_03395 [Methylococcales bacterium]|nr:hypothetical protein [Methylococcales bacterium]